MQKTVTKTGDHGIGIMIHVVHMTDDVAKLTKFYEEVFLGYTYLGQDEINFLPNEDRWATLIMIGDYCVEVMAPNQPVNPQLPVGKFYTKFGQHLHSVGYKVDDLEGLGDRLIDQGVYIGKPGGGKIEKMDPETVYFYPSPRDTAGLMCARGGVNIRVGGRPYTSCRATGKVIINLDRWWLSAKPYRDAKVPLAGYRHYVINHEVGHELGHGHQGCPKRGRRAPVMVQQTLSLQGCTPYAWPR